MRARRGVPRCDVDSGMAIFAVRWRGWLALLFAFVALSPLPGQPTTQARANNLLINGAIGAATGAVWAAIRHRPAREGLTRGLLGGGVMSVGRQVAGTHRYGSGLAGREVSAVGIALTTSSGDSNTTVPVAVGPFTVILGRHTCDTRETRQPCTMRACTSFRRTTLMTLSRCPWNGDCSVAHRLVSGSHCISTLD